MKVRLLNLAVYSAIAMGTQAAAQEPDQGLERALADLNNGLVAPAAGGVTAGGSTGLDIGGDFRLRNTNTNPIGAGPDYQNVDARMRLNFAFDVNENASAFIQFIGAEIWGNPVGPSNAFGGPRPGFFAGTYAAGDVTATQGYVTVHDLVGDGGDVKVGRSNYTFGSGRLLGTDDWDNFPISYSGLWYSHPLPDVEDLSLHAFMITDAAAGGTNFIFNGIDDIDLFGAALDWGFEAPALGNLALMPYWLRMSNRQTNNYVNWYGGLLSGEFEMVSYEAEAVWQRDNIVATSGSVNAWAIDADIDLGDSLSSLPIDPVVEVGVAQADPGMVINPTYHNVAGLADVLGFGGVWGGLADTWRVGIGITPMEGWDGHVTYVNFDDNTGTGAFDASEIDLSVSHDLNNGVSLWAGLGRVDFNAASTEAYVGYITLGLPF